MYTNIDSEPCDMFPQHLTDKCNAIKHMLYTLNNLELLDIQNIITYRFSPNLPFGPDYHYRIEVKHNHSGEACYLEVMVC